MEEKKDFRKIEDYSIDELKRLYRSISLYMVTEWMKYRKRYKNDQDINALTVTDDAYGKELYARFFNSIRCKTIEMRLANNDYKTPEEKQLLINEKTVLKVLNEVLFWCAGGYEQLKKDYNKGCKVRKPSDMRKELHETDYIDKFYKKATKIEIYKFIWETLRFYDAKTLGNLCRLSDNKFETNDPHRPAKNKPIYKYDKDGNLIAAFPNRDECIKKDNISKEALSMVLSGKRKQYKGFKYVEENQ